MDADTTWLKLAAALIAGGLSLLGLAAYLRRVLGL